VIILATNFLNNDAKQQETVITVVPFTARFEFEATLPVECYVVLESAQFQSMFVELWAEEVACSASVCQQMMDGHLGSQIFVWIIGKIFSDGPVELELAILHELHGGHGRKHLVHGADPELRAQVVLDFLVSVGKSIRAGKNWSSVFGHHHRTRKTIRRHAPF